MEALTHTKRSTFKECRYRFYLRHELGLELIAQKPGRRRGSAFGSAIYNVASELEGTAEYNPDVLEWIDMSIDDSYQELLDQATSSEARWEIEVEMAKLSIMVLEYLAVYGIDKSAQREMVFDLPLVNPSSGRKSRTFTRAGKIDGMLVTGDRRAVIVEDKLYQSIDASMVEALPLDEQVFEYVDALAQKGWAAEVEYRITRYPGINPAKAKEFKTKADVPAETVDEFRHRLREDVRSRREFYFVSQRLLFDQEMLVKYRQERWDTAKDILETRTNKRWYRSTSRCKDFGGCIFLPHCRGHDPELNMYRTVADNVELQPAGEQPGEL